MVQTRTRWLSASWESHECAAASASADAASASAHSAVLSSRLRISLVVVWRTND